MSFRLSIVFVWIASLVLPVSAAARTSGRPRRMKVVPTNPIFFRPAPRSFRDRKCLRMLRSLKVPYRRLGRVKGVATPVKIIGTRIGRIQYKHAYNKPVMVMDCRMALAMVRASELLRVNNIKTVVFSNFYSYRNVAHSKRLSKHALGLAIDIHGFYDKRGRHISVLRDYQRGLGVGKTCEGQAKTYKARVLRDLVCDMDKSNLFSNILTGDFDKGHLDHFHVSVFHPLDRRHVRKYRTVLGETRGTMYPWTWSRPARGHYRAGRMRQLVKWRWRARRRWYTRKRLVDSRHRKRRRPRPSP